MEPNNVIVTRVFKETFNSNSTIVVNRGGARSSKSWSIAQLILFHLTNQSNSKILVTRKTLPSLKITAYKLVVDLLKEYGYYNFCLHNKTDNILVYPPTNSYILFTSIDDAEKIKSTEWNYIWMEEATGFKFEDYMILKLRLSAPTKTKNHMYLSFNPIGAFHWCKTQVVDKETDMKEIVSTYKDNPFLEDGYIKLLEDTKHQDKNYWKIYGEGQWGSLENIIYSNWKEVDKIPTPERTIFGCDFGFNAPTSIVELGLRPEGVYVRERLYRSGMTNNDLISWINNNIPNAGYIYCDNAEPARIQEMRRANINAHESDKSVKDGIDFVRRQKLLIDSSSINTIKEIQAYQYKEDKDGNVLEDPVKMFDHSMDSIRYALYTHLGNKMDLTFITSGD